MKKCFGVIIAITIIIMSLLGTSCNNESMESGNPYADDIAAVRNTITANLKEGQEYQAGSLQGGTAVLISDIGAYWVKDGVVYAANGTVKTWSFNINYAPAGVDFNSVKEAVDASH